LKKVRIWLESKTPEELKQKLKAYSYLRWFIYILTLVGFVVMVLFIFASAGIFLGD
jgi:hypothetical protein